MSPSRRNVDAPLPGVSAVEAARAREARLDVTDRQLLSRWKLRWDREGGFVARTGEAFGHGSTVWTTTLRGHLLVDGNEVRVVGEARPRGIWFPLVAYGVPALVMLLAAAALLSTGSGGGVAAGLLTLCVAGLMLSLAWSTNRDRRTCLDDDVTALVAHLGDHLRQADPTPVPAVRHVDADPVAVAAAVADLRAALDFLASCSETERAAIESENAPLTVDDVAAILRDSGLRAYADAAARHDALPPAVRAGTPPPVPDRHLVQAARDVLSCRA